MTLVMQTSGLKQLLKLRLGPFRPPRPPVDKHFAEFPPAAAPEAALHDPEHVRRHLAERALISLRNHAFDDQDSRP